MTRQDVLIQACDQCMKELYEYAVPHIDWEQFKKECDEYSKKYKEWDNCKIKNVQHSEWKGKSIEECIGLPPYEFYYLPKEIMRDICDSYIYAYELDHQQNLLDIIEILKKYCKEPIVDKQIEEDGNEYRGYEYSNNLEKELYNLIPDTGFNTSAIVEEVQDKFFEFLDKAGKFYKWNGDLNNFNMTIYLGVSPCSNKESVIENWKKYKNIDIEINEEKIKENYYGEEINN